MMGRRRKHRKDLPQRVYYNHGAYYFVTAKKEWIWLGRDIRAALRRYSDFASTPTPGRMSAIMDRYMAEWAPAFKAPRTVKNNEREVVPLKAFFGHLEPHEVTPTSIYQYMDERPAIAANREVALLSAIFKFAIRKGLATENPCKYVSRNPEKPRDRHVEDHEYATVYSVAPPVLQCAMTLASQVALRLSDLLNLNEREHIREDGLYVPTGKTKVKLLFQWNDELQATVDRCRTLRAPVRSLYLISTKQGQKYTVSGFETMWRKAMGKAVKAGLKERFVFNDIRAMAAGKSDNPTELLGHNDPKVTNRIYRRGPRLVKPNRN